MQNKLVQMREGDHGRTGDLQQFQQEKMNRESRPGSWMISKADRDSTPQSQLAPGQRLRRESPHVGNDIGVIEGRRGIPEKDEGTVHTRTDQTEDSAPKSLLVPEGAKRQTPPAIYAEPSQRTWTWHLGKSHRSGRSHWRPPKGAPDLCGPPALDP